MMWIAMVSTVMIGASVFAKAPAPKVVAASNHSKLSTDVRFDGQTVGGKIQSPAEALSVVENEKSIDDLIGVRKDFRDRSSKAKGLR